MAKGESSKKEFAAIGKPGAGFDGLLHAKGLLVGNRLLMGSTNWTTSSRANLELGCLCEVGAADLPSVRMYFWSVLSRSAPLDKAGEAVAGAAAANSVYV